MPRIKDQLTSAHCSKKVEGSGGWVGGWVGEVPGCHQHQHLMGKVGMKEVIYWLVADSPPWESYLEVFLSQNELGTVCWIFTVFTWRKKPHMGSRIVVVVVEHHLLCASFLQRSCMVAVQKDFFYSIWNCSHLWAWQGHQPSPSWTRIVSLFFRRKPSHNFLQVFSTGWEECSWQLLHGCTGLGFRV